MCVFDVTHYVHEFLRATKNKLIISSISRFTAQRIETLFIPIQMRTFIKSQPLHINNLQFPGICMKINANPISRPKLIKRILEKVAIVFRKSGVFF